MITIIAVVVLLIGGAAGAVLFMRKRSDEEQEVVKDFSLPEVSSQIQQSYPQPAVQQPVAVAEPTVLRQWTDEAGYTWRAMDDGSNYWWTGTEWQKR